MARTRPSDDAPPRARLFVALDMAEEARAGLVRWRDEIVAGRDGLRPVPPAALHLTLVFLGWREEGDIERVAATLEPAAAGVSRPRLLPVGVKALPPLGPRLFALDLEDEEGRAGVIQASLSSALERERLYSPERRPFWPHVTLARVRKGQRAAYLAADALPAAFDADRLTLYRSTLRPEGARYDALARVELAPA